MQQSIEKWLKNVVHYFKIVSCQIYILVITKIHRTKPRLQHGSLSSNLKKPKPKNQNKHHHPQYLQVSKTPKQLDCCALLCSSGTEPVKHRASSSCSLATRAVASKIKSLKHYSNKKLKQIILICARKVSEVNIQTKWSQEVKHKINSNLMGQWIYLF